MTQQCPPRRFYPCTENATDNPVLLIDSNAPLLDLHACLRERLNEWNENNPEQRITVKMPDIWKRVREMGKDRTERIADTAPKALRQQMRDMAGDLSK